MKMKKLSSRYYNLVFSFTMAVIMSGLMSFVVTSHNLGFSDTLVASWLLAWRLAFVIAFPILLIVAPMVRKITARFVTVPNN